MIFLHKYHNTITSIMTQFLFQPHYKPINLMWLMPDRKWWREFPCIYGLYHGGRKECYKQSAKNDLPSQSKSNVQECKLPMILKNKKCSVHNQYTTIHRTERAVLRPLSKSTSFCWDTRTHTQRQKHIRHQRTSSRCQTCIFSISEKGG